MRMDRHHGSRAKATWANGIGARLAKEIFAFYKGQGITNLCTSVQWDATDVVSFFKTLGFHRSNFINLEKSL